MNSRNLKQGSFQKRRDNRKKQILSQHERWVSVSGLGNQKNVLNWGLEHRTSLEFLGWMHFPQNVLEEKFWAAPVVGGDLKG